MDFGIGLEQADKNNSFWGFHEIVFVMRWVWGFMMLVVVVVLDSKFAQRATRVDPFGRCRLPFPWAMHSVKNG